MQTHADKIEELKQALFTMPGITLEMDAVPKDPVARAAYENRVEVARIKDLEEYDTPVYFIGIHLVDRVLLQLAEERLGY